MAEPQTALATSLDDLREAHLLLNNRLMKCGFPLWARMRAVAGAEDVLSFSSPFLAAHRQAVRSFLDRAERAAARQGAEPRTDFDEEFDALALASQDGPLASRLKVMYKGTFFFVRAYQDVLYQVMLSLLQRKLTKTGTMDSAATKEMNPVRLILDDELPEYIPWFVGWRQLRNQIKDGSTFSLFGPEDDLGIAVDRYTHDILHIGDSGVLRLQDVAEGMLMSGKGTRVAIKLADERLAAGWRLGLQEPAGFTG